MGRTLSKEEKEMIKQKRIEELQRMGKNAGLQSPVSIPTYWNEYYKNNRITKKNNKGFTVIELMIGIMAIVAAVIIICAIFTGIHFILKIW